MSGVKFVINGDSTGAKAALEGVEKGIHHLSHEINAGFRESVIGAFSLEAIKAATEATIDFAEQIKKSSERMGVTTDNVQALRIAARAAGKDIGFMEKAFQNLEKASTLALGGNSKTKQAFRNLGVSDDDIKHKNKVDLLSEAMAGTQGMTRSQATQNLSAIFGTKAAGGLMAMQPELANFGQFKAQQKDSGAIASNEDIEALAQLKDRWLEVVDAIKASAIPVLSYLLEKIFDFSHGVKQVVDVLSTVIGSVLGQISKFDISGLIQAFGENLFNGFQSVFDNLWGILTRKISVSEALDNLTNTTAKAVDNSLQKVFGVDVEAVHQTVNDKLLELGKEDSKLAKERAEKAARRVEEQKKFDEDPNRQPTLGKKPKEKMALDKQLSGGSDLIKIGGLTGVDTSYRLERLQTETNNLLEKVVDNTQAIVDAINENMDNEGDGFNAGE